MLILYIYKFITQYNLNKNYSNLKPKHLKIIKLINKITH